MEETRDGLTFAQWKRKVNVECARLCGLTSDDLPDAAYWDMWDSGESPEDAAGSVLEDEGFPFDE